MTENLFIFQLITSLLIVGIILLNINWVLKKFKLKKEWLLIVGLPTVLFFTGFMLRLQKEQAVINEGYFLTEISFIVIYTLFTISFLLGQIKYYKLPG